MLNFGCGKDIKEGYDNADIQEGGDLCFDFNKFPYPIEDNTYDYVYACDVLEHLNNVEEVLYELRRISKPNAVIEIIVPYYNSHYAFNDLQHKHYFSDIAFIWFVDNNYKLENNIKKFKIVSIDFIPSVVGKFIYPKWLRKKLSYFVGHIIQGLNIKLKVM